jgi:hypothetical protein
MVFAAELEAKGWMPNHPAHQSEAAWTHVTYGALRIALDLPPLVSGPMKVFAGGAEARAMGYDDVRAHVAAIERGQPMDPTRFRKVWRYSTKDRVARVVQYHAKRVQRWLGFTMARGGTTRFAFVAH